MTDEVELNKDGLVPGATVTAKQIFEANQARNSAKVVENVVESESESEPKQQPAKTKKGK